MATIAKKKRGTKEKATKPPTARGKPRHGGTKERRVNAAASRWDGGRNNLAALFSHIDRDFDNAVERLKSFLRIPSVSTDPKYKGDVKRAAEHVAADLRSIGFDTTVHATQGHPMVVGKSHGLRVRATGKDGRRDARPTGPSLLYYGHYDVQPPEPLDLWKSPPFEPTIEKSKHGQKITARGAVDDKGQVMLFIEAFRAWKKIHGYLPCDITILLEGEEESGSKSLDPFLKEHKRELQADVCIVSDTGMWDIDTPAVTTRLRGLVYVEVTLHGPSHDLHSGMYGGAVANPCNDLCRILAELKDKDGRIQVPGFYDDVEELTPAQKKQWKNLGFDEKEFLGSAGLKTPRGEKGRSTLERTWSRPTCDINGIYGGYIGAGAKTVIASKCTAKVSFRLVPVQDPKKIFAGLKKFLEARTPPDCRWEVETHGLSPAIRVQADSPWVEAAKRGLAQVFKKEAVLIGTGGSIPLVGSIQRILGFDALLVGFGLDDDRVHSPNEKFELTCFRNGIKSHAAMLAEFAGMERNSSGR